MSKKASKKSKPQPSSPQPSSSVETLLLDLPAAARALSSSVWTVRGLLWNNEIPHIKVGRKFLIRPSDLRSFIERKILEGAA